MERNQGLHDVITGQPPSLFYQNTLPKPGQLHMATAKVSLWVISTTSWQVIHFHCLSGYSHPLCCWKHYNGLTTKLLAKLVCQSDSLRPDSHSYQNTTVGLAQNHSILVVSQSQSRQPFTSEHYCGLSTKPGTGGSEGRGRDEAVCEHKHRYCWFQLTLNTGVFRRSLSGKWVQLN